MNITRRHILPLVAVAMMAAVPVLSSCDDDDDQSKNWETYKEWREDNQAWFDAQAAATGADGQSLFKKYTPSYNAAGTFLMRFIGDPAENAGNLQPLFTSTATVNYQVHLYDGTRIDSAANYTSQLSSVYLIAGWSEMIMRMHVGDSIEAILPYGLGYGSTGSTSVNPYSALRFNIRLTDVPTYVVRP